MAWILPNGKTSADLTDFAIHGGGSISPYLLQPHNQWSDVIKTIAPAIKDYIDKKKADEIANSVLNLEGLPQSDPNTGLSGANWLKAQQLYQQYKDQQEARTPDTATDDLNYLKLWQQTHPDETGADGSGGGMTPYQREQTRLREMDIMRKQEKDASGLPPGVPRDVYNASKTQSFDPAQAFRDRMTQQQAPSADGAAVTPPASDAPITPDNTPAPTDPSQREKGKIYSTPRGNLRWTGTGWVTP